ncbi:unnamed protein product [Protopolystoma xenopodis]|uniref:Uncharacterized protein n=1 Tax=Protopolystoma xenopodis TaxID=117903 RepID=A0A448XHP2_9PLAT|nr:unnamed protein product [Protopolystoma xenopodis]
MVSRVRKPGSSGFRFSESLSSPLRPYLHPTARYTYAPGCFCERKVPSILHCIFASHLLEIWPTEAYRPTIRPPLVYSAFVIGQVVEQKLGLEVSAIPFEKVD